MHTIHVRLHCGHCNTHFNVDVATKARYEDVLIRHCPLCGNEPHRLGGRLIEECGYCGESMDSGPRCSHCGAL
jgi:hypothetical protein